MRLTPVILALVSTHLEADTEIHRCLLEDGTTAFQEMPCSEAPGRSGHAGSEKELSVSADEHAEDESFSGVTNDINDTPSSPELTDAPLADIPSKDRVECEKTSRDAIDAIDAEMRQSSYTSEQGREYLAELLVLTRQLRACKQLPAVSR